MLSRSPVSDIPQSVSPCTSFRDEIGRKCSMMEVRSAYRISVRKPEGKVNRVGDPAVDGRVILKGI